MTPEPRIAYQSVESEVKIFKRMFSCFLLSTLAACTTVSSEQSNSTTAEKIAFDVKERDRGRIVDESFEPIGHDFYDVSRSIENSPSHWEGIGHFGYIFYKQREICRCSPYNTSISPDGQYLLFANQSKGGALEVFDSDSLSTNALSNNYVGYPVSAEWSSDGASVLVTLDKYDSLKTSRTFMLEN